MSEALKKLLSINPIDALEKAVVCLLRTRPFLAKVVIKLPKVTHPKVSTMGVGFVGNKLCLAYNEDFVRLAYFIDIKCLGNILAHEALHIACGHLKILAMVDKNKIPDANIYTDLAVNFFAKGRDLNKFLPKNTEAWWNILFPCPVCTVPKKGATLADIKMPNVEDVKLSTKIETSCKICSSTLGYELSFARLEKILRGTTPDRIEWSDAASQYEDLKEAIIYDPLGAAKNSPIIIGTGQQSLREALFPDPSKVDLSMYDAEDEEFLRRVLFPSNRDSGTEIFAEGATDGDIEQGIAMAFADVLKAHGESPGDGMDDILDLQKGSKTIPWREFIRRAVCQSAEYQKINTRTRPNRRFGFQYPGDIKSPKISIVVAIDTSGSMSDNLLEEIKKCILSLENEVNLECTIFEFDYNIQRTYDLRDMDGMAKGRGGTSLSCVPEWLMKNKPPAGSLVFTFTDGYGDLTIDSPKAVSIYKFFWMITNGGSSEMIRAGMGSIPHKIHNTKIGD